MLCVLLEQRARTKTNFYKFLVETLSYVIPSLEKQITVLQVLHLLLLTTLVYTLFDTSRTKIASSKNSIHLLEMDSLAHYVWILSIATRH